MNITEYPTAVVCVQNAGNEISLQLWKIYKPLRDDDAKSEGFLRIVDESGEDYLFPETNFVPIELPAQAKKPFERAIREQRRTASAPRTSESIKRVTRRAAGPKRARRLTSR